MAGGAQKTSQFNQATTVTQADQVPLLQGGELKRVTVGVLTGNPDVGWQASGESWAYSSWNSTTRIGVVTVPSDATTKYFPGMRVRISQTTGGTKYGIIHRVTSTTLVIHFPSGTSLANEAISSPVYSPLATPVGFNCDPTIWLMDLVSTAQIELVSPTINTWYNPGSIGVALGPGAYEVGYEASVETLRTNNADVYTTLSTSNSTETDKRMTSWNFIGNGVTSNNNVHSSTRSRKVSITSDTTYYFLIKSGAGNMNMKVRGADASTAIKAITAYL